MSHKIDKLFQNKLGERQSAPSTAAWQKLQGQLNGKRQIKKIIFYRIAAVFLLLFISASVFITFNNIDNQVPGNLAESSQTNEIPKESKENNLYRPDVKKETTSDFIIETTEINAEQKLVENIEQSSKNKHNREKRGLKKQNIENEAIALVISLDPEILPDTGNLLAESGSALDEKTEGGQAHPSVTITFKKGKKNIDGLAKNTQNESEEISENDNTTLKKFLKMAKDLKYSELSLADIRDSKEDLLGIEITKLKN